uniref:Uncharacterized protein n=1 Tax=Arundo donax TaxID=35708 RepID=A0A0A9HYH8_ARUDO
MLPHETRISHAPQQEDGHICADERQHHPVRGRHPVRPSGDTRT